MDNRLAVLTSISDRILAATIAGSSPAVEFMAQRIRARAVRRAGELLKQLDAQGSRADLQHGAGDHTKLSQADAAREAGFSKHQQVQAVRIANVPEADFAAQVDALGFAG